MNDRETKAYWANFYALALEVGGEGQNRTGDGPRCDRCRRYVDVAKHKLWPEDTLCQRCVGVLLEIGDYLPYKVVDGVRVYISELEVWGAAVTN